ncbi:serine hydrolase [Maribacter polysiphoniae]|uniref:CubicO group peptidase (Beta-lactamase class C family) n=1 Tax=Maribacter polysiphoniae TaxID=429344 RepID=A0A316DT75_9FLAO|nr:serine hydrolase [Maribacter polysiphoniae]MBD1262422.1 serine hydrolase [Maribacter polysiphoniae]PWK21254.1 CubicO group peptidase (beta-lactamase class C family) [Maribacter polysiphoniae]
MKVVKRVVVPVLILLAGIIWFNYPKLNIISGFAAKSMASNQFIAHRSMESVNANDHNVPMIKLAHAEAIKNGAMATVYGLMKRKAICNEGSGCVLINDDYDINAYQFTPHRTHTASNLPFPYGDAAPKDTVFDNVDYQQLNKAIDGAFANAEIQKTRTVLVAYKNRIVGEKYIDGFTKDTPILGWSMTKSILATLYGILEYEGKIDLKVPAPIEDWQQDERKNITLDHLLRMQSGLAWDEDYTAISDVTRMLFLDADMTLAQKEKEAIAAPTELWNYSSGTTNLLSGILRDRFETHQEYLDYPYKALIDRIGMNSMLIETDMKGNYVGSSYGWANTRDWAKFGLLYLNKGDWNGERLFDASWVDYITTPTAFSKGTYGAHFWLNAEGEYPDVPKDLYSANGYQGQYVFVIPSKELVVVRTGLAEDPEFDVNAFLSEVIKAIH